MTLNQVDMSDAAAVHVVFLKLALSPAFGNSPMRNSSSTVVSSSDQLAACLRVFDLCVPPISRGLTIGPCERKEWLDELDLSDMTNVVPYTVCKGVQPGQRQVARARTHVTLNRSFNFSFHLLSLSELHLSHCRSK